LSNQLTNEQELATLKIEADELGITYSPSIGVKKLKEKIAEHTTSTSESSSEPKEVDTAAKTAKKFKARKLTKAEATIAAARNLVKVKVVNLDANEAKLKTQYVCAGNQDFEVARVIPFNTPIGLQQCLIDKLKQDKMIVFVDEYDHNGRLTGNVTHELVDKYNVVILE
jgi:hypothetical protein